MSGRCVKQKEDRLAHLEKQYYEWDNERVKNEHFIIRPFNTVYKLSFLLCIIFTWLTCFYLGQVSSERAQFFVLSFSYLLVFILLAYKVYLLFDKDYEKIRYPGQKVNVYNELIFYPCNVITIVYAIGLTVGSRALLSFAFFFSVCPILALLFPPIGFEKYSVFTPRVFCFYLYHFLIVSMAFFVLKTGIFVPVVKDSFSAILLYAFFSFLCMIMNFVMVKTGVNEEANYFYNMYPEGGNPALEFFWKLIPYPYLFTLPPLALTFFLDALIVWIVHLFI